MIGFWHLLRRDPPVDHTPFVRPAAQTELRFLSVFRGRDFNSASPKLEASLARGAARRSR